VKVVAKEEEETNNGRSNKKERVEVLKQRRKRGGIGQHNLATKGATLALKTTQSAYKQVI